MANALKLEQLLVKQNNGEHNMVPKFEKSKYILIHFIHATSEQMEALVAVDGTTIYSSSETNYKPRQRK